MLGLQRRVEQRTMCSLLQYTKSGCLHLSHCSAAPSPLQYAHAPDHADAPTALNLHCSPPPPARVPHLSAPHATH